MPGMGMPGMMTPGMPGGMMTPGMPGGMMTPGMPGTAMPTTPNLGGVGRMNQMDLASTSLN